MTVVRCLSYTPKLAVRQLGQTWRIKRPQMHMCWGNQFLRPQQGKNAFFSDGFKTVENPLATMLDTQPTVHAGKTQANRTGG